MEKTEKLTRYYRWQFLRLNENYQRDSDFFATLGKAVRDNCEATENEKQEGISKIQNILYIRYGINGIYDYKIKNPPPKLRIYSDEDFPVQKGTLKGIFSGKLKENQQIRGNHLLETMRRPRKVEIKRKGTMKIKYHLFSESPKFVQVVLNYDAELGDIHREIDRIIKPNQKVRRKEFSIKRPQKPHFSFIKKENIKKRIFYDQCLQVWCLFKKGVHNKDIAKKIFRVDEERAIGEKRAAEDKAIKYRKRARELINGEYRKITF